MDINTEVKDLDDALNSIELPEVELINAPETLEDAIQRIMRLEMALDDLARATEIAQFSKQYHLAETYIREAEELLETRIIVPEEDHSDFKFTLLEGEVSEETKKALVDRANNNA